MNEKMKRAWRATRNFTMSLIETLLSGVFALVLYVIYLPFGICMAIFSRKMIRDFFSDVLWAVDGLHNRIKKREEDTK